MSKQCLNKIFVLLGLMLMRAKFALADPPDPLTGIRISMLGVQTTLAAPPLPDLRDLTKGSFTVQASFIAANVNSTDSFGTFTETSTGNFRGGSVGLGFTTPVTQKLGYFAFATGNLINGNVQIDQAGTTINLNNMKNMGLASAFGASLRLWDAKTFPFMVGIFGGFTLSYFNSQFDVDDVNGNLTGGSYDSAPFSYGGMGGIQGGLDLFGIYLNPYIIYYEDFTDGCKAFNTTAANAGGGPSQCSEGNNYIKLPLSYAVYGINVGFKGFFVNAYSHLDKDSSLNSINLNNYQLAYTFKF